MSANPLFGGPSGKFWNVGLRLNWAREIPAAQRDEARKKFLKFKKDNPHDHRSKEDAEKVLKKLPAEFLKYSPHVYEYGWL